MNKTESSHLLRRQFLRAACAGPVMSLLAQAPKLRIIDPPDGAILNRHDGRAVSAGLEIQVSGECAAGATVKLNGRSAEVRDGKFSAKTMLDKLENRVVATSGSEKSAVTLLWDRHSFPRYRVSTDDNIWFIRDIARNADRYQSIFETPYLGFWQEMHMKYGTKVHFNIYYETDGFNLSQFPGKYKPEWQSNRDWIRLTFHARANDPARPYAQAPTTQLVRDYRLVTREIERFAGEELLSPVTTVHWGETTREGAIALRKEGIRIMPGYFRFLNGRPLVSYYLDEPRIKYIAGRDYWKDTSTDIIFIRHDAVLNTLEANAVVKHLEGIAADPHQSEVFELMIHEQYFYPDYKNYEPDYRLRVERAIEWVTREGYKPVFYSEGFLGCPY